MTKYEKHPISDSFCFDTQITLALLWHTDANQKLKNSAPLEAITGILALFTMTIAIQTLTKLINLIMARGVTNGDWVFLYIDFGWDLSLCQIFFNCTILQRPLEIVNQRFDVGMYPFFVNVQQSAKQNENQENEYNKQSMSNAVSTRCR